MTQPLTKIVFQVIQPVGGCMSAGYGPFEDRTDAEKLQRTLPGSYIKEKDGTPNDADLMCDEALRMERLFPD